MIIGLLQAPDRTFMYLVQLERAGVVGKTYIYKKKKKKLYPPVCSTMRASLWPEAIGREIAITAKLEKKGRIIFLYWEKIKN